MLTGVALVNQLIFDGLLHTDTTPQRFCEHLKAFIEAKGHMLITNNTNTTFFLSKGDIRLRVSHSRATLVNLNTRDMDSLVFADERTLEENPHPKGGRDLMDEEHS